MSMMRTFKKEDAEGVKNLILNILSKEYPFDRSAYSDSDLYKIGDTYGGKRDSFFVIEDGGQIVGTAGIKEESHTEALLRRLFVDIKHRKKGYGTDLINKAITFCKEKGYKKIYFRCTDRMADAMRLCVKNGFKETEKLKVGGFQIHKLELSIAE
ncbi:MAG: GNAT family N-acetyltransferase [Candidatus Omnitrophica bacterium]|nr:GNAT family N-acetyltransferase [Candidatus Omnitrophota bacterium]